MHFGELVSIVSRLNGFMIIYSDASFVYGNFMQENHAESTMIAVACNGTFLAAS